MTEPAHAKSSAEQTSSQPVEDAGSTQQRHLSVAPDPLPEEDDVLTERDGEGPTLPHPNKNTGAENVDESPQSGESDTAAAAGGSAEFGERLRAWAAQLVMSPELVTHQRPSLKQVYHYARFSPHVPSGGLARALMLAHVWGVALPTVTTCYALAWAVERPARFYPTAALAATVAISMSLWTPTRWLLTVLLAPLHFAGMATDALTEW